MTVDCAALVADIESRIAAGETPAELLPDLYYGVLAELEEALDRVLALVQSTMEGNNMNQNPVGLINGSEPMVSRPLLWRRVFCCC